MNLTTTWGELARAAGGRLVLGNASDPVWSVSTDTRTLNEGEVFWALKGPHFDAHNFLTDALAKKAGGWIVEPRGAAARKTAPSHLIEVPNTLKALQAFALWHRRRFNIPVVGITGSNGKTTTKEMLKSICERSGYTCASPGNWNNQIGVPLSVLSLTQAHRYGIFELADSKPGDIREVAMIARPTLAIVTNIGADHMEFYESMEQNFKTKAELLEALPPEGRVVINIDDPWLASLEGKLGGRAVTFGTDERAKVCFSKEDEIMIERRKISLKLASFGKLSRYNAAAAAAAAWALGIDTETIRSGLASFRPFSMRLEVMRHPSGAEIVVDAYNANPSSMDASIDAFCSQFAGRPKILVLGDMKELGKDSAKFHDELGRKLSQLPLKAVYLAGPEMAAAQRALAAKKPPFPVFYSEFAETWVKDLKDTISKDNVVLLKASRAMKFETVLDALVNSTISNAS